MTITLSLVYDHNVASIGDERSTTATGNPGRWHSTYLLSNPDFCNSFKFVVLGPENTPKAVQISEGSHALRHFLHR